MKIIETTSNNQVARELGQRVKDARISASLTQKDLSERAGVSERTITNLECGRDVTCSSLFSVLRSMGMLSNVDMLVPEQGARPSDYAKLGKKRQRASRSSSNDASQQTSGWVWGDDK